MEETHRYAACRPAGMKRAVRLPAILSLALASLLAAGCGPSSSDFEAFMGTPLPSNVKVTKMDGNWGHDPWRCWEISPADADLKRRLVTTWGLAPNPRAFHGVASGDHIYCRYDDLSESYSADSDSYRAVGIDAKRNIMVVYFYNG
jgi:hypothetical protein